MEEEEEEEEAEGGSEEIQNVTSWDCGSPLYDSYELVSINNQLDRGLATLYAYSTPLPDRHIGSYNLWISSHTKKLKRAAIIVANFTSRFLARFKRFSKST